MATSNPPIPPGNYQYEIYLRGLADELPTLPLEYDLLETAAKEALSPESFHYAAGGAGEGRSMDSNRGAFDRWQIVPRMLGNVSERDLSTQVLNTRLPAPVMLGPVGVLSILRPEAEVAVARAAAETGVAMCLSTAASSTMEDVAEALGPDTPGWYQLYWPNNPELAASPRRARGGARLRGDRGHPRHAHDALAPARPGRGLPALFARRGDRHTPRTRSPAPASAPPEEDMQPSIQQWAMSFPNPTLDWYDLPTLREHTSLPILVKGVLHPDDARRAVDLGIDSVIVSNHGGRQVDGLVPRSAQLPAVVEEVGDEVPVLMDSGVRTGSDVLKAVALGASAVLVARQWVWGLALEGQAGVEQVVKGLLADLDLTMAMCGKASIAEVRRELVQTAG